MVDELIIVVPSSTTVLQRDTNLTESVPNGYAPCTFCFKHYTTLFPTYEQGSGHRAVQLTKKQLVLRFLSVSCADCCPFKFHEAFLLAVSRCACAFSSITIYILFDYHLHCHTSAPMLGVYTVAVVCC